jgi:hypothetical protein
MTNANIFLHLQLPQFWTSISSNISTGRFCLFLAMEFLISFTSGAGVESSPLLLRPFIGLLYQLWMTDCDDCVEAVRLNECKRNRSTRKNPAPVPLRPPQIPHDMTRNQTRATGVESWRITVCATAWPHVEGTQYGPLDRTHVSLRTPAITV